VTRPALDVQSFGIDPAYPHAGSIRVQPSLTAILGVIFGVIGKKKVEESGGALQGRGMALAGAICGAVAIGLFLIWLVLVIIGVFNSDSNSY
jgi:hypothetical protein